MFKTLRAIRPKSDVALFHLTGPTLLCFPNRPEDIENFNALSDQQILLLWVFFFHYLNASHWRTFAKIHLCNLSLFVYYEFAQSQTFFLEVPSPVSTGMVLIFLINNLIII
jgi:hypothetical protein